VSGRRELLAVTVQPALAVASRSRQPGPPARLEEPAVVVPEAPLLRLNRRQRRHLMDELDAPPRSLLLGHRLDVEA